MFYCEVDKNDYVFKQDDVGSCFFLFDKGQLSVIINNQEKKVLNPGDGITSLTRLR
jgi:hypothetical protein